MVILLAVLALIVVKALANSPWGLFTVAATIPIALAMGLYSRFLRPHRILEMSAAGVAPPARRHLARRRRSRPPPPGPPPSPSPALTLAYLLIGLRLRSPACSPSGWSSPRATTSPPSSKSAPSAAWRSASPSPCPSCTCPPSPASSTAPARSSPAASSPSCSSPSPVAAVSGFHALVSSGTTPKMLD